MRSCFVVKTDDLMWTLNRASATGIDFATDKGNDLCKTLSDMYCLGFFAERFKMENREDFKQIIPCFMIRDCETNTILIYQRQSGHTEGRLAGKWTPVFGGHVDPNDEDKDLIARNEKSFYIPRLFFNALKREMEEETGIKNIDDKSLEFEGFIYDDSDPVGRVHLGILFSYYTRIDNNLLQQIVNKPEIANIIQVNEESLEEFFNAPNSNYTLEGWAQIALSSICKIRDKMNG